MSAPPTDGASRFDVDVAVIGSGFGGSVSALRLTEKGYRVAVLEAGRRFLDADLPRSSWDMRAFLWAPALGCYGIQRVDVLHDVGIMSGAGVGGGSLVYANTLYEPLAAFYRDPQWADITDWRDELTPYYRQARQMLGVQTYPHTTPSDVVMREVAEQMGVGDTFVSTPVGVHMGAEGTTPGERVTDPYFGGAGPSRRTCTSCGECMTGCRHDAKNTLVKNYLHLAEANGARIIPMTTVDTVSPLPGGGYAVETHRTDRPRQRRRYTAEQVVVSASALGTQRLLHRMRDEGHLPRLSARLGELTRTNSESILGAIAPDRSVDYSQGVAITSSFHPDESTHVEPVRYGRGSNALSLIQTVLTDGGGDRPRWQTWLRELWRQRRDLRSLYDVRHWSERTIIALVMQSLDNSITTYTTSSRLGRLLGRRRRLTSKQGHGAPNPTWIPAANEAVRRIAAVTGGFAGGTLGEPFDIPLTAHFMGGCPIGSTSETGVVDAYQRVYGHEGLHVVDGSAVSANLGVNPSLTITAQAERAMSFWPNRGETDQRPSLGGAYRRLEPVAPKHPAVPDGAPGALHLPIVGVS